MTNNDNLVVRKRTAHGQRLWWIGRGKGKDFMYHADVYAPTGYGYNDRDLAIIALKEIKERLASL
jgi:hypothetical protein